MFATRIIAASLVAVALAACNNDSTSSDDGRELAAFCDAGARIGDTSTLTDVDSSDPASFERTYDATIATLATMIPTAPASAQAQVQAGHDILVEFRVELEAVQWNAPDLSPEAAVRWINLSSELVEVSPAIRAACA